MLNLFAHPFSPHSRKAHFALEEAGHPYTYNLVDLTKGEQKSSAFLARNPVGKVPVLQEDDFLLPESGAILHYIAEHYAKGTLLPADKHLRARVDTWLFWLPGEANLILHKPFQVKMFARMSGKAHDEAAFQAAVAACTPVLKHIDDALADKQFLVGDSFSIADIAVAESIFQTQIVDVDLRPFANLQKWYAGIGERPAFKKTRPSS